MVGKQMELLLAEMVLPDGTDYSRPIEVYVMVSM